MADADTQNEDVSPLPGGKRSRAARARGIRAFTPTAASPQPSLRRGEGEQCSLRETFAAAVSVLREAGVETPELDARLLLCHAAGLTHEAYVARMADMLSPQAAAQFRNCLERRVAREPVARILGLREFYGRDFLIDRHALDPRPDTETLIEAALGRVARDQPLRLLDVGTGNGCILITLLAELPLAIGIGTDISGSALALAARNAQRLGVADRAALVAGDWLEPLNDSFDLIVSNPPYVTTGEIARLAPEVRLHDPLLALDGGADGLAAYRWMAGAAAKALRPGGTLIVEIGADQADAVLSLFRASGLSVDERGLRHDLGGRPRAVIAQAA
jgi:release factor glutamine methyltransferase